MWLNAFHLRLFAMLRWQIYHRRKDWSKPLNRAWHWDDISLHPGVPPGDRNINSAKTKQMIFEFPTSEFFPSFSDTTRRTCLFPKPLRATKLRKNYCDLQEQNNQTWDLGEGVNQASFSKVGEETRCLATKAKWFAAQRQLTSDKSVRVGVRWGEVALLVGVGATSREEGVTSDYWSQMGDDTCGGGWKVRGVGNKSKGWSYKQGGEKSGGWQVRGEVTSQGWQ